MKGTKLRGVHTAQKIENYRELLEMVENKYFNNIAYKYKKDATQKEPEYIEKTYGQYIKDVKALSTGLLNLGLENKKVIVIGSNRYEWCTTYMAVTTGNMIIVPLDKALPNTEIKSLVTRSGAEAIVFDKKYKDIMIEFRRILNDYIDHSVELDPFIIAVFNVGRKRKYE